jgi:hypothetical protein
MYVYESVVLGINIIKQVFDDWEFWHGRTGVTGQDFHQIVEVLKDHFATAVRVEFIECILRAK